jgi:hypothetical protein
MTITKTCGFAAIGAAVGVGSGAAPVLGIDGDADADGDVAAGEAHATTNATTTDTRRRVRTRSQLSHRDPNCRLFHRKRVGGHGVEDHIRPVRAVTLDTVLRP